MVRSVPFRGQFTSKPGDVEKGSQSKEKREEMNGGA
jgi:hypothetical protein